MDLLIEAVPYLGGLVGLIVVWLLAKWGININKQVAISGSITVMQKLMEIFGWVEEDSEKSGIKGPAKLSLALSEAKKVLTKEELKAIGKVGKVAEKHPDKPTFGDNLKAGIQDIFVSSVSMLAKDKLGKLIKKI